MLSQANLLGTARKKSNGTCLFPVEPSVLDESTGLCRQSFWAFIACSCQAPDIRDPINVGAKCTFHLMKQ